MSTAYPIVVCGSIVPGPPVDLRFTIADLRFEEWQKNEMMLSAAFRAGTGGLHSAEN